MLRWRVFVPTLSLLLGGLLAAQLYPLASEVFRPDRPVQLRLINGLSIADLAALKLRHARARSRYDVGLFGNSRAVGVSAADLGLDRRRFFNFALPGGSIRQSIAFLEALHRSGKAPRTAVISLDQLELQYFGNPSFPGPPRRWALAAKEIALALRSPTMSLRDRLRVVWRHLLNEWTLLTELFNAEMLRNRLAMAFFAPAGNGDPEIRYRSDGSRSIERGTPAAAPAAVEPQRRMIIPEILDYDLARLGALGAAGIRIVVYESPLAPGAARRFADRPSPHVANVRQRFLADCARFRLECYTAPVFAGDAGAKAWPDASHAPAGVLGPYIAKLIGTPGATAGDGR